MKYTWWCQNDCNVQGYLRVVRLVGVQAQREREVALAAQLGRGAHAHAQALVGAARAPQHVLHEPIHRVGR